MNLIENMIQSLTMFITASLAAGISASCVGTNNYKVSLPPADRDRHYQDLRDRYANCTRVDGNLELTWLQGEHLDLSFLRHIREVTGYVLINHVDVGRLVLPRLHTVHGRDRFRLVVGDSGERHFSLLVMLSRTNSLELSALTDVWAGDVGLIDNYNLCHAPNTVDWDAIIAGPGARLVQMYNFPGPKPKCPPCDASCTTGRCWGEGPDNCQKPATLNCSTASSGSLPDGRLMAFNCSGAHDFDQTKSTLWTILISILVYTFTIIVFLKIFECHWKYCARPDEMEIEMKIISSASSTEEDLVEPPPRHSNIKPNTAKLRIVREEALMISAELGNGAFGVVYKGVWAVGGSNTFEIPVAIKKLHKMSDACNGPEDVSRAFLEEAYIMASVEHDNLVKLLAVCMACDMMLVTELMPLGCLSKYVRNNKDAIDSGTFLKWCTQIAKGMSYLEENRLVHRDLAARNVLVQNADRVKITDFGLAKLLDVDQPEYIANGGRMPVKWLAPECLKRGVFTHKSDVWAFGVTVWELLTYGQQPYGDVEKTEISRMLETGHRLPQPPICTIDVYMVMVKCWLTEKDGRPSFRELVGDFARMAVDPGRYLVIPGDRYTRFPSHSSLQNANESPSSPLCLEGCSTDLTEVNEYDNDLKIRNGMPSRLGLSRTGMTGVLGLPTHSRQNFRDRGPWKFGDIRRIAGKYANGSLFGGRSWCRADQYHYSPVRMSHMDNPMYHLTGRGGGGRENEYSDDSDFEGMSSSSWPMELRPLRRNDFSS